MKRITLFFTFLLPFSIFAQSNFNIQQYHQFLLSNHNLESQELLDRFSPKNPYYSGNSGVLNFNQFTFIDSIQIKYKLTKAEIEKLKKYQFMVTERLSFNGFGEALHDIYKNDLPLFLSTDAVLHALHMSYDAILMDLEVAVLRPKLLKVLDVFYRNFGTLVAKYQQNPALQQALTDVDLYVTIAKSLLDEQKLNSQFTNQKEVDAIWDAIQQEKYKEMPLFSERNRRLDFSQFTVRGHYTQQIWDGQQMTRLDNYFKAMMWLGRMDFFLTPPPVNPWEEPWSREEIRRMNLGAVLLNELVENSGAKTELNHIDEMITFMVGESDNITPSDLSLIITEKNIQSAEDLLNDIIYDLYYAALTASPENGQKILSSILLVDPFSTEPSELPVSFRLMGQRFIVDSYVFSNVVFDRIVYNEKKIWRPLPDPLDAMFVLGNDDALPLLKEEVDQYYYGSQLSALRYLVDSYGNEFWNQSLYNVWLNAIRLLNPDENQTELPFFMQTTAWHQEKLNTQLASWAQLRHDNLLYAKQSYTGGTACSFPHSFIEPYPEFYTQIGAFAEKALDYFSQFTASTNPYEPFGRISMYFPKLKEIMDKLTVLSQKELDGILFDADEQDFLKRMLFQDGMSGAPPFSGWYPDLYYIIDDAAKVDYVIADVHTQPTDYSGAVVGRVLHVGVGKVNLGVFLANSPSDEFRPMAFVGPVMSYYEQITENFDRLTDERWSEMVKDNRIPERPDWINSYLIDSQGVNRSLGRELQGVVYSEIDHGSSQYPEDFNLFQNYPNPFNPETEILYSLKNSGKVTINVYNLMGQKIITLFDGHKNSGLHRVSWNGRNELGELIPSGIYLYQLTTREKTISKKMTIMR